jgi:hypothetical protein
LHNTVYDAHLLLNLRMPIKLRISVHPERYLEINRWRPGRSRPFETELLPSRGTANASKYGPLDHGGVSPMRRNNF